MFMEDLTQVGNWQKQCMGKRYGKNNFYDARNVISITLIFYKKYELVACLGEMYAYINIIYLSMQNIFSFKYLRSGFSLLKVQVFV